MLPIAVKQSGTCLSKHLTASVSLVFSRKVSQRYPVQTNPFQIHCTLMSVLRSQEAALSSKRLELGTPAPVEVEARESCLQIPPGFDVTWDSGCSQNIADSGPLKRVNERHCTRLCQPHPSAAVLGTCSASRHGIESEVRNFSYNKVGTAYLSFSLTSCSIVEIQCSGCCLSTAT